MVWQEFELTTYHPEGRLSANKAMKAVLIVIFISKVWTLKGAQWLSGRVLDSRLKAFPASLRCVLEQDTLILA